MSDIQFDEPGMDYARQYATRKPVYSGLTNLFVKAGFAKDEKQAGVVMVALIVVAMVITYLFWPSSRVPIDNSNPQPLPSDVDY